MSVTGTSGTMGSTQLLSFINASAADAIAEAGRALGFSKVNVQTGNITSATDFLRTNASPEILLVEVANAEDAPSQLDALADVVNPHTKVLVCGPMDSYRFYHWLMDLGIHEYLLLPFTAEELKLGIVKGAAKKQEAGTDASAPQNKKLIAVIGARGGVGTSTIATNLGAFFAREMQISTAIIDLDPYFGTIAMGLDLEPGRGLRDALEKPDRVDALFLERVMVKPFAPLSILSAEEPLSDAINPQANAGEMIFTALMEKFSMIVVDLPRQMNAIARYVLGNADEVYIIAEPHLISLRDSLRIKDFVVEQLKRPAPHVIMNRVGLAGKQELPSKDFIKHFGAEPVAHIAYLPEAYAANAKGELLIDDAKMKPALTSLRALAMKICDREAEMEQEAKSTKLNLLTRLKAKK